MREALLKELDGARYESCRHSLALFMKTYLPEHCKKALQPFHLEIIVTLEMITRERGKQFALAAPRNYGKSTIVTLAYVLWCAVYGHEAFIVIVAATNRRGKELFENIRKEVNDNQHLRRAAPDLIEKPATWRVDYGMTAGNVKIIVSSVESELRGVRHGAERPTLILCDDIETEKNTRNQQVREKFQRDFMKEIQHLGSNRTNVVLCGTVLNPRSLLGLIFGKKGYYDWISLKYSAVITKSVAVALWERWQLIFRGAADFNGETGPLAAKVFFDSRRAEMLKGATVLWEEREDYYSLMVQLEQKGEWAFFSEKQNDPKEDGNYDLDEKGVVPWDENGRSEESLLQEIGNKGVFIGAIDPAYVEGGAHDFTVITTVLIGGPSRTIYVLDAIGGQWRHETTVEHMVEMNRRRKYTEFILESNGAQRWLMEADAIRRNHIPIRPLESKDHKHSRIRTLFLAIQSGSVKLSKRHLALWEQLFCYPHTDHDDYIDSLAMAVSAARGCAMGSISIENQVEILQNFAYRSSRPSSLESALSSSSSYVEARLVGAMTRLNK